RYCRVAVSEGQLEGLPDEASGVICGATNFAVGDRVALALPGAVLPGGFEIGARKTYGHISEGMICSASELALGDDHTGILVLREVRGFDPSARTPLWMVVRLARCAVRSVSLAVDVTNYLMFELGQPIHAFDRSKLTGEIVVRRAQPGEQLETLDHVVRSLDL